MKNQCKRVLVANRGEIALRVMRTCRDMGIETIAIFSEPDRVAPHVLFADYAYCIGPATAADSYLRIDKVIGIAKRGQADAIHPGYGFLSESAEFAKACQAAEITLVGPPPQAMTQMGSKTHARQTVIDAGAPVVPGDNGPSGEGFPDSDQAMEAAARIGFPVLIKASAGGGGKGMRLVSDPQDFAAAFAGAKREAAAAFGNDIVYIEKAIERARHIEIQVFADTHGQVVHLGERDCSMQRRHQKVIEETPSVAVDEDLRKKMGASAVQIAKFCDYVGAGTIEFLLDASGSYYFLEMNTRLQVEHPVTESVYGVDLVEWQLRVARGEKLPMSQPELDARRRGCAMEFRIYAEDPVRFLPSPGTITHMRVPEGPNIRNDSGTYEGAVISPYYDPMISKLVVSGDTRVQVIRRAKRALSEYVVRGIETNIPLHRALLEDEGFSSGEYDTHYLESVGGSLFRGPEGTDQTTAEVGTQNNGEIPGIAGMMLENTQSNGFVATTVQHAETLLDTWRHGRIGWTGNL